MTGGGARKRHRHRAETFFGDCTAAMDFSTGTGAVTSPLGEIDTERGSPRALSKLTALRTRGSAEASSGDRHSPQYGRGTCDGRRDFSTGTGAVTSPLGEIDTERGSPRALSKLTALRARGSAEASSGGRHSPQKRNL